MLAKIKQKKCKICKKMFSPFSSTQVVCDMKCAIELSKAAIEKEVKRQKTIERKERRKQKEKLKPRSQWLREAQASFNAFVRERDRDEPCISCGSEVNKERRYLTVLGGAFDAGHYRSVGSAPDLRFHPFNNNKQCKHCNNFLSGNIVSYRPKLLEKIGAKNLEWLEGPVQPQKLTIDDIKEIKAHYKEQLKILKSNDAFYNWQMGLSDD